MKANELMIGDIVQFNGSPYIIEEISKKGWIHMTDPVHNLRVPMSSDYILDFIEGFPLTEELLQRHFPDPDDITWFPLDEPSGVFNIYWEHPTFGDGELRLNIRYVHELQHALRLCGIEKDIKLDP